MSTAQLPATADPMTIDEFRQALPDRVRKVVNQSLVDQINVTLADPDLWESYRDNLLSYASVMTEGKFKMTNYLDAVKYVSHKLRGVTNQQAYTLTFPQKVQRWVNQGVSAKDQSSYISAYNKSKLVNLIYEQTLIPTWVLNQDMYQKALNTQAELMLTANSEMVRTTAANSLLQQLKPPETQKVELDVNVKEDSSIAQLREATMKLAAQQRDALQSGAVNAQEVAHSKVIVDGEFEEI